MERKDKETIAKLKLIAIRDQGRKMRAKLEKVEELRLSLYGTGIDYSKDNVQITPANTMEIYEAEIDDLNRQIEAIKSSMQAQASKLEELEKRERFIILNKYFNDMSISQISKSMKLGERSVKVIHKKALVSYYNTCLTLH